MLKKKKLKVVKTKRKANTNIKDNAVLRGLLTEEPEEWVENEAGIPVLAIYDRRKIKGELSGISRLNTLRSLFGLQFIKQLNFAHLFRMLHMLMLAKKKQAGKIVLDLGCGESEIREMMWRNFIHVSYVGMELSKRTLEHALEKKSREPYMYLQKDLNRKLPFKNDSFDLIIFTEMLEHVIRKRGVQLLKETYRVLKPGGQMYLSTPDDEFASDLFKGCHIYQWTGDEVMKALKQIGYRNIIIQGNAIRAEQLRAAITPEHKKLYRQLEKHLPYYLVKAIMAVLYPEESHAKSWISKKPVKTLTKKRIVK